jgi:thioesterase domain-containing protein
MTVDLKAIERYLHTHIPLTRSMRVSVEAVDEEGVRLAAPLAPNINHRNTVFGGSAGTLAILSAWTLLHTRLGRTAEPNQIVIQRSSVDYLLPLHGDFQAFCPHPAPEQWNRFVTALERRGRGRITLEAEILGEGEVAGRFEGVYVVMRRDHQPPRPGR